MADPIRDYAVRLVLATHPDGQNGPKIVSQYVRWGASPRAAQPLVRAGRVRALTDSRAHLAFEDIRYFAFEVLQHRIILNYDGQAQNVSIVDLICDLMSHVPEQV